MSEQREIKIELSGAFLVVFSAVLATLKLAGVAQISWTVVFMPIVLPIAIVATIWLVVLTVAGVALVGLLAGKIVGKYVSKK